MSVNPPPATSTGWAPNPAHTPQPVERRVQLATGLNYHLLEWGAESTSDHSVVLIHGFLDLGRSWQPVVESGFGAGLHVIAPDMRGHGHSDRVGAGGYYHFMDYLADLASLVEQLGRDRVSLVGHSMGGSVASYFAGAYPQRIHKLVLLEGLGPPEDARSVGERVATWVEGWRRQANASPKRYADHATAAARLMRLDPLLDEPLARWLVEHSTSRAADGSVRFLHDPLHLTTGPHPFRLDVAHSFWDRVSCPALFVEGAESFMRHTAEESAARKSHFRDGRSEVLEGAGHMLMRHRPRQLALLLQGFLG